MGRGRSPPVRESSIAAANGAAEGDIVMLRWLQRLAPIAGVAIFAFISGASRANTIQLSDNNTSNYSAGLFKYNVDLVQGTGTFRAETNDHVTLNGFNGISATPTFAPNGSLTADQQNWQVSVLGNAITLTYKGTTIINADQPIGVLSATSTIHGAGIGTWRSFDHQVVLNVSSPSTATGFAAVPVPLPATANMGLVLLGGVGGLGALRRLKNSKTVEA